MIAIPVSEASQVAEARREASAIARRVGFGDEAIGRVALVTTELATNLVKHGGGGEILAGSYEQDESAGVEILALDRGRGISNIGACLEDGYSSAGSRGEGLGAVIRQSQFFDIASWPGGGTAILARLEADATSERRTAPRTGFGAVSVPLSGEEVCGDSWTLSVDDNVSTLFVADGLGHGGEAAEASTQAVRAFHRFNRHRVSTLLDYVHGALRSTRGAAISIARFDRGTGKVEFAGVGNVAGLLASKGQVRHMVSMPGLAGYNVRKIQCFEYPFEGGLIILHSDGLSTGVALGGYRNLEAAHPTLIAGMLYRDFTRHRDDATVLVGKWAAPSGNGAPA
jgi:anti-sigma regulatory factor (Ser/Thr protein kinase)